MSTSYTALRYDVSEGLAHVTLTRPEEHNSLTLEQGRELEDVTSRIQADESVRCVLLDAEGTTFHVGGDLRYFGGADPLPAALRSLTGYVHSAVERLSRGPAPVVAAVNGVAAGGGMSLILGSDLVIAGEAASFTMAYTAAGLTPDASSSWFLPRLVGLRRAQELIFTNRKLSAHEAMEWGIVTEVVADEILADHALEVAQRLAKGPTRAYAGVKKLLRSSMSQGLESQMADESEWIAAMGHTEDARNGIAAFLAKERPTFNGR